MTNLHGAIIDSRDIIERIEELEDIKNSMQQDVDDDRTSGSELALWLQGEEAEELNALIAFATEASQYSSDWEYGETLIHEDYFTEYCMEMLKDCGELPTNISWYIVIDEEATAENLKSDYVKLEFDGQTYYMRAS